MTVDTVRIAPRTAPGRPSAVVGRLVAPKPSSSSGRKPSGPSAPRSAATLRVATAVAPTWTRPTNPPAIPALTTVVYAGAGRARYARRAGRGRRRADAHRDHLDGRAGGHATAHGVALRLDGGDDEDHGRPDGW